MANSTASSVKLAQAVSQGWHITHWQSYVLLLGRSSWEILDAQITSHITINIRKNVWSVLLMSNMWQKPTRAKWTISRQYALLINLSITWVLFLVKFVLLTCLIMTHTTKLATLAHQLPPSMIHQQRCANNVLQDKATRIELANALLTTMELVWIILWSIWWEYRESHICKIPVYRAKNTSIITQP